MSPAQLSLILRCIAEDYVEVGYINSVNPRTAEALVEAGLLVHDWPPGYQGPVRRSYVRLVRRHELLLFEENENG